MARGLPRQTQSAPAGRTFRRREGARRTYVGRQTEHAPVRRAVPEGGWRQCMDETPSINSHGPVGPAYGKFPLSNFDASVDGASALR